MKVNLIFLKKDGATESFQLPSTVTTIGRREDCDFCIPLNSVSRRHCQLDLDKGKVTVRDLKSRNGTLVNGKAVDEVQLNAGDVLKIGPIELVVQIDGVPAGMGETVPQKPAAQQAVPESAAGAAAMSARYSAEETQEAEFNIEHDLSQLSSGHSQTVDFNQALQGFDLEDDLDLDTEVSNL